MEDLSSALHRGFGYPKGKGLREKLSDSHSLCLTYTHGLGKDSSTFPRHHSLCLSNSKFPILSHFYQILLISTLRTHRYQLIGVY